MSIGLFAPEALANSAETDACSGAAPSDHTGPVRIWGGSPADGDQIELFFYPSVFGEGIAEQSRLMLGGREDGGIFAAIAAFFALGTRSADLVPRCRHGALLRIDGRTGGESMPAIRSRAQSIQRSERPPFLRAGRQRSNSARPARSGISLCYTVGGIGFAYVARPRLLL